MKMKSNRDKLKEVIDQGLNSHLYEPFDIFSKYIKDNIDFPVSIGFEIYEKSQRISIGYVDANDIPKIFEINIWINPISFKVVEAL